MTAIFWFVLSASSAREYSHAPFMSSICCGADAHRPFKKQIKPDTISAAIYCKPKPMTTERAV